MKKITWMRKNSKPFERNECSSPLSVWLLSSLFVLISIGCAQTKEDDSKIQTRFDNTYLQSEGDEVMGLPEPVPTPRVHDEFEFSESISRRVLENYLQRSITLGEISDLTTEELYLEEYRLIEETGVKFLGRATGLWGNEDTFISRQPIFQARNAEIHEIDPSIIIQAAIYEHITPDVSAIQIPCWVYEEFGLPCEDDHFFYGNMDRSCQNMPRYYVPDLSLLETQMWYFYLAATYIDAGFEAIHLGILPTVAGCDPDLEQTESVLNRIRNYARTHARRGYVILDAHTHGMIRNGHLLLDFHSAPLRPKEVDGEYPKTILRMGDTNTIYGRSLGGIAPSGWFAESLPYLVELDNGYAYAWPRGECTHDDCVWGWDEISWFAFALDAQARNDFLIYASSWLRQNDPNGFLQMPGLRIIDVRGVENVPCEDQSGSTACPFGRYCVNAANQMSCGHDQERVVDVLINGESYCGDRIVQVPNALGMNEECDDGNRRNDDGCSSVCTIEEGPEIFIDRPTNFSL